MRVTRNLLLETARNHVESETYSNPNIACVFLVGSLASDEPFIGETTDIDLVFIHNTEPSKERDIIPVADNFHLDILNFPRRIFNQPKTLRHDPWLGCLFCEKPFLLYDTFHFYDFLRAGVYSQFFSATNTLARSKSFYDSARKKWMNLRMNTEALTIEFAHSYVQLLMDTANAIACLVGKPVSERRFLSHLEKHTTYLGRPGLASGMRDLYALDDYSAFEWDSWQQKIMDTGATLQEKPYCPTHFSSTRLNYYLDAASHYRSDRPDEALWIMLWLWTCIMNALPKRIPESKVWKTFCESINLNNDVLAERVDQADAYLDAVEETMDDWKKVSGLL